MTLPQHPSWFLLYFLWCEQVRCSEVMHRGVARRLAVGSWTPTEHLTEAVWLTVCEEQPSLAGKHGGRCQSVMVRLLVCLALTLWQTKKQLGGTVILKACLSGSRLLPRLPVTEICPAPRQGTFMGEISSPG